MLAFFRLLNKTDHNGHFKRKTNYNNRIFKQLDLNKRIFFLPRTYSPSLLQSDNMDRMITLFMITLSGSGFHYTVIEHNPS